MVDLLVARGVSVVALARSDPGARELRERGAEVVRGELGSPGAWERAVRDADVVFHAGQPRLTPPLRGRQLTRLERRSRDAAATLAAVVPADVPIVVATCGIGDADGPLRISRPALAAEAALAGGATRVVRMPWAYGPGGFIRDMARGLQMRRLRIVGPGTNRIALVGARDAAGALVAVASAPAGLYGVEEEGAPTQVDLVHHLCIGRGAPRPDHLPPGLARFSMGGVVVEALMADQRVIAQPVPGFRPSQEWTRDLLDALLS